MNNIVKKSNIKEFSYDKKQIMKQIKYNITDLFIVKAVWENKFYYFLCTFNSLQNYYIEVLTNAVIKSDENIDVCHLPTFLNELNINYIGYLNYYELIYLYNKLRNMYLDYNKIDKCDNFRDFRIN